MKSLASISEKDIETIKMALNDSISDMNTELKGSLTDKKRNALFEYHSKYTRVFDKLKQNSSLYALSESDLDIVAGGLNDAVELLEDNLADDLDEDEREEILTYKNDCARLVEILCG
jgi:Mg/Co/Ni transporter MgtE